MSASPIAPRSSRHDAARQLKAGSLIVHRAVETCDDGGSDALDELRERFEDADEPISAIADIEARLDERVGPRDVDDDDPAFVMACAIIVYVAYRRDELDADPTELLALAARAEFDGHPPPTLSIWLEQHGVAI